MALKAVLDTLEGLSEELKKEYKEITEGDSKGKFMLDVTAVLGLALDDTSKLKTALQKERSAVEEAKKSLKAFKDIDPEAAREALAKLDEIKNFNPDQKVAEGVRQREEQLVKKHKKEIDEQNLSSEALRKQLEEVLVDNAVVNAVNGAKGNLKLLQLPVKNAVRMRKTDGGKYIVEVVDADGTARVSPKAGSQDLMTISELINEMKSSDDYSAAFASSGASGSGTENNGNGNGKGSGGNGGKKTVKTVAATDQQAMSDNLDAIASGEVSVSGV